MITATLEGLGELLTTLSRAGTAVRLATGQKGHDLAEELAEDMRSRSPDDRGNLDASIRVETADDGNALVIVGDTPETARPTSAGTTYDEALLTEYGTTDTPAQPFFNPAIEARREEIGEAIARVADETAGAF